MALVDEDRLLTPEQVAELLQKSPRTLKAWRCSEYGVVGPRWIPVGGEVRYWLSDVMAWLEEQRQGRNVR